MKSHFNVDQQHFHDLSHESSGLTLTRETKVGFPNRVIPKVRDRWILVFVQTLSTKNEVLP